MLRPYQQEAVNAVYDHLRTRKDNPCVVLPTGAGKTHVIKTIATDAVERWGGRVLILAHVKELLQQAAEKLELENIGIYSAGLKRRDTDNSVIVGGIQSVYKKAGELGPFDLIIVDEAHLIPPDGEGMYQRFLSDALLVNPKARLIGLTATPYRMTTGLICEPDHLLNHVCCEASIPDLIAMGYLCPVRSKSGKKKPELDGLHIRGGEFIASEIDKLMDTDLLVDAAVAEIQQFTKDRHSVLVFASSVRHAMHLQTLLPGAGLITGDTPAGCRAEQIEQFKNQEVKYLVSVNVLSIGFDAPNVDAIALLRPTLSPGLYYQQVGRGLRIHESKKDCLILDFAGNIRQHGPIDAIEPIGRRSKGKGESNETPIKECAACQEMVHAAFTVCPACGHEFPEDEWKPKHSAKAAEEAILSEQAEPEAWTVRDVFYHVHTKKDADENAPRSLRVDYMCGIGQRFSEWVCVEHEGFAKEKAHDWWKLHSNDPFPVDAEHAKDIGDGGGIACPSEITLRHEGKWPRIIDRVLGEKPEAAMIAPGSHEELPF